MTLSDPMSDKHPSHACDPEDHYIGIDVGTGSARACIIDARGEIKALAAEDIKLWQPQAGYYEQSTADIWQRICNCVRRVITDSQVSPISVKGIGFAATCSLAVFSDTDQPASISPPDTTSKGKDHNDQQLRNVILWLDHRAHEETVTINTTNHKLLQYVGGKMSIEMEIPKILWLRKNLLPDTFASLKFYDLADALTHMATGNEMRSFCSTVCKQGFLPKGVDGDESDGKGWQKQFFEEIGLGDLARDDFARMGGVNGVNGAYASAGEHVGRLSKKAAQQLGLCPGTSVGSGVIDAYAGWIGTVGAKTKLNGTMTKPLDKSTSSLNDVSQAFTRLAAVAGTSTCHLAMAPEPIFVPGVWGPYRDVIIPNLWMAEGGQSATGQLLNHILTTHPAYDDTLTLARAADQNIYDWLNNHLEHLRGTQAAPSISHLARHHFFYGDFWGNRSPIADASMRGAMIGLSSGTSVDDLALWYYSCMEFIALQTRQIVLTMNEAGHAISSIYMSGSQCRNPLLMRLIANVCRMPVFIPRYVDAAVVHGSAMLGVRAASESNETLWSIMERMSKIGRVVETDADRYEMALLDAKYNIFLDLCEKQQEYRRRIDQAIYGWD